VNTSRNVDRSKKRKLAKSSRRIVASSPTAVSVWRANFGNSLRFYRAFAAKKPKTREIWAQNSFFGRPC
jgi:hypothetical protein